MEKSDPFLYPIPDLSIAFSRVLVNLPKTGGGENNIKVRIKCHCNTVATFLARKTSVKVIYLFIFIIIIMLLFFFFYSILLFLGTFSGKTWQCDYAD